MTEWYLLPGMGATSEMYGSLKRELRFKSHFLNWPQYKGEKSFSEVAERIIAENQISKNDIVGGSSLGGMVALEIAMILNTKAVVLMGSCLKCHEIKRLLYKLAPLASITPLLFIKAIAGKNEAVVSRMFAASDTDFVRSMCQYVSSWPGYQGPMEKVFRIHGQKDHIITCSQNGSDVIGDAGHLLAITHPKKCAAFLGKIYYRLTKTTINVTKCSNEMA